MLYKLRRICDIGLYKDLTYRPMVDIKVAAVQVVGYNNEFKRTQNLFSLYFFIKVRHQKSYLNCILCCFFVSLYLLHNHSDVQYINILS